MTGRSRPEEADSNFLSAGPPPVRYFAVAFPQPQFLKFRLYGQELAKLVRIRPVKQLGLQKLRELFRECSLPEESTAWVESIRQTAVERPPYSKIVQTIEILQKKFRKNTVHYGALRVELSHLTPSIVYETDDDLFELCRGMAQMAPGAMYANPTTVELDQSAENVVAAIEAAMQDYPIDEQ